VTVAGTKTSGLREDQGCVRGTPGGTVQGWKTRSDKRGCTVGVTATHKAESAPTDNPPLPPAPSPSAAPAVSDDRAHGRSSYVSTELASAGGGGGV